MITALDHLYDAILRPRLDLLYGKVHGPAFAAACWIIAVFAVVWWRDGRDAMARPQPVGTALLGAAVVWLIARWWISRIRPLVLVANFVAAGGESAAEEASAFRDRIMDAIRDSADVGEKSHRLQVRGIEGTVDPHDPGDWLGRAKSLRAPVLVAGKVRVDSGEWHWDVRVLTVRQQVEWSGGAKAGRRSATLPAQEIPANGSGTRGDLSTSIAVTAKQAAGIALLAKHQDQAAYDVLTSGSHTTPLALFYAAVAAMRMDRWEQALEAATQSFGAVAFSPSAAVAAIASFNMDGSQDGRAWLQRMTDAPQPGPGWDEFLTNVQYLALGHGIADIGTTLADDVSTIQARAERERDIIMDRWAARESARLHLYNGNYEGVLQSHAKPPEDDRPADMAMYAVALAHLERPEAPEYAARTEDAVGATLPAADGAEDLTEAYARLGMPESFARVWEWVLAAKARTGGRSGVIGEIVTSEHHLAWAGDEFWAHPAVRAVKEGYWDSAISAEDPRQLVEDGDWQQVLNTLSPEPSVDRPEEMAMYALALAHVDEPAAMEYVKRAETAVAATLPDVIGAQDLADAYAVLDDPVAFARVWGWELEAVNRISHLEARIRLHQTRDWILEWGPDGRAFWEHPDVTQLVRRYEAAAMDLEDADQEDSAQG